MSSRAVITAGIAAVIAMGLAWRLAASLAGVAVELTALDHLGRDFRDRIAAIGEPHDVRRRRSLGFADRILRGVEQHVPADGVVALVGAESRRNQLTALVMLSMLWPRRIVPIDGVTADDVASGATHGAPLFVLTLDEGATFPAQSHCERIDGNKNFAIWRAKDRRP